MVGPVDDPLASVQISRGLQGRAVHQRDPNNTLPEGLNVRDPGHHGGLQGVRSVMVLLRILSQKI